jgi:hypothetical protein
LRIETSLFLCVGAAAVATAHPAPEQANAQLAPTILYKSGQKAADQGMTLKGWGSGSISQTDETSYAGTYSIQVSSRNFFQGGIISLATGDDVSGKFDDKDNLLKITFKTADSTTRSFGGPSRPGSAGLGQKGAGGFGAPGVGPGGPGGVGPGGPGGRGPGGFGGGGGQGFGGGGAAGFGGGGQGFGAPGLGGRNGGASAQPETLKTMRLIVTTSDMKKSEAYIPVDTNSSTDNGWKITSIPLQAINGFDKTNKVIKEIAFAGDATATFYIGDLRIVNDSTPIHGEIENGQDLNLALGDTVTFHASGTGGASTLKYSWDFGTAPTPEEDAVGQTVIRKFRKSGTYTVTLTVQDAFGLKTPYSTTIHVKVN